ncbi:hypothetical protein AN4677.2 [Aspergillus nidulans FGSC A4]|uniref:Uncharacterized protein n=1 Tax=Emericella nidulans (strain FGSC A4 / ATCC 38163 / CBS 112.46 / NRRL 194 / M139) TaxID=227321 RepID=Q5B453_EMENI|nr:hypothetical protein [Aspergillus nidulans FGSC A4]EAA60719.1 hypothetical protein AN4677.2 [Aspergillus nidulans FGSC A4]CBF77018.1 TPA: conserved hypothetical protein [Aspergillus nidulans FGSC A4]|eukprot:XP_662281.1 hypothetical protein AN4677.2 [Aspergillus nidulans FGSC A4]
MPIARRKFGLQMVQTCLKIDPTVKLIGKDQTPRSADDEREYRNWEHDVIDRKNLLTGERADNLEPSQILDSTTRWWANTFGMR